ncbi:LPD7 domain-containing protein [Variovorax saccharolyticus]|uniref:LPD7 domain-containing protein n=1 Tax=Variovorax saccharolyticus TaxID=3053516 RepID=UPI002574C3F4|nr:LPD7 domain-containing protein [Variovorax sp. J22R187]MDM0022680.1 hypothetical protein [Variovorax sp. J22R187]
MAHDPRDPAPLPGAHPNDAVPADSVAGEAAEQPPNPGAASNRIVPDGVARRFLRIDDRYFFPDRTLAFIDQGTRLKVRTHNLEVVHSVVAIMQARGWRAVQLKGTEAFRRAVWHEAGLQGIEARGYAPSELERQQLQWARARRSARTDHPGPDTERGAGRGAGPADQPTVEAAATPRAARPTRDGLRPPVVGELLAHAAAPYHFDPGERMSYYARVRTPAGERTFWGADLERALAESRSGVQVGDAVSLRQRGARAVTVRVAQRNEAGELVGETRKTAQRMGWSIEKTAFVEALGRKAEGLRQGHLAPSALLAQYPDLAGALVSLRLAQQFARRLTPRADDQQRVVEAIRYRLADALERGERIGVPTPRVPQATHAPAHTRSRAGPRPRDPELGRE